MIRLSSILIIILVCSSAFAKNWIKAPGGVPTGVTYTSDCGEDCFCLDCDGGPPLEVDECDVVDVEVDDPNFPIWSKKQVTPCAGQEECVAVIKALVCEEEGASAVYAEKNKKYEAYCTKFLGFEKKTIKQLQVNPAKKAAKAAAKQAKEDEKAARKAVLKKKINSVDDTEAFRKALAEEFGW